MTAPAVVVCAFDRPDALRRLLHSIETADYPPGEVVPLVISIDAGGARAAEVLAAARAVAWSAGPLEVVVQPSHLGLVGHLRSCGERVRTHGVIILLEEDLVVSPRFHGYATQALAAVSDDDQIALVSLYAPWFHGYTQLPFLPIEDGADAYFAGVPFTQGMAFTLRQWEGLEPAFRPEAPMRRHPDLPEAFQHFGPDEWFPRAALYCVETGRSVVYPRVSLTTGWGEPGVHFRHSSAFFQVPLQRDRNEFRFHSIADAGAIYDASFELTPRALRALAPRLPQVDIAVDLYASKDRAQLRSPYVLTSRPSRRPIATFGKQMWPLEANVIHGVPGDEIALASVDAVDWSAAGLRQAQRSNRAFFSRGRPGHGSRTIRAGGLAGAFAGVLDALVDRLPRNVDGRG